MQTKQPSVKALQSISRDIDRAKAIEIRAIIGATEDELETYKSSGRYPKTEAWARACWNRPKTSAIRGALVNEAIGGFGVESVFAKDADVWAATPIFEYINLGATYAPTLCLYRGRWLVSDWGTLAEKHSKEIG